MKNKYYYSHGFTIRVLPNPDNTYGTTSGSGKYNYGSSVQIGAYPKSGYAFMQWSEGESSANPRTITVTKNAVYNALFYKIPNGELRIVDNSLNLYTYSEYASLSSPPAAIGVAINDVNDWIVYYKENIGIYDDKYGSILGYKLSSDSGLPSTVFTPSTPSDLLYPHSGLSQSNVFKEYAGSGYAAYEASLLTDGGLTWYIPNIYELSQILGRAYVNNMGANECFNSYFTLAKCPTITTAANTQEHAYWTCDVGIGGGATKGEILPFRIYFFGTNNKFVYYSSGNYCFPKNYNYVRPVARIPQIQVTTSYNANGADSGIIPSSTTVYKGDLETIATNSGDLSKSGSTFNGWNTAANGGGTHFNVGTTFHNHTDLTLYAEWV